MHLSDAQIESIRSAISAYVGQREGAMGVFEISEDGTVVVDCYGMHYQPTTKPNEGVILRVVNRGPQEGWHERSLYLELKNGLVLRIDERDNTCTDDTYSAELLAVVVLPSADCVEADASKVAASALAGLKSALYHPIESIGASLPTELNVKLGMLLAQLTAVVEEAEAATA